MKQPIEEIVGENVLRLRKASGLSQRALAEKAGVSQRIISNIEQMGGGGSSGIKYIDMLAEALGVSMPIITMPGAPTERGRIARTKQCLATFEHLSDVHQGKVLEIMEDYLELSKSVKL